MEPVKFAPIFKETIWGGSAIAEKYGKTPPAGMKVGESWELSDIPSGRSVVACGKYAGKTLGELLREYPEEIMGDKNYSAESFPLMIKFIDANDVLSVQVHPDAELCKRSGKGSPKTECWYILDAAPGACIYKGLKPGTTCELFAKAIKEGTCEEYLEKIEVKVGECHFLPSGVAHAIGAGLLIAEIQQPSDTTYRVFDWNRVDADGNPRELHVEDALEAIHFDGNDNLSVRSEGRLVDAPEFKLDKLELDSGGECVWEEGNMAAITVVSGSGRIKGDSSLLEYKAGDTMLLPHCFGGAVIADEESCLLIASL
ncbi:MAG: type I phosphomannose isomerase catalytic subunit [Phycisphaerae bacterium]